MSDRPGLNLQEQIESLRSVGAVAYEVSPTNRGWQSSSVKPRDSQELFVQVFNIGTSILRLVDTDPAPNTARDVLDPASIGALTRNLMEAGDAFWYLVVDRVSSERARFRQLLWRIHYHREALRVKGVLAAEYSRLWEIHSALGISARMELKENREFSQLSGAMKKSVLRGDRPWTQKPVRPRSYLSGPDGKAVYKYLSNVTHAHPLGVYVGVPYAVSRALDQSYLVALCLELAVREVAWCTLRYVRRMRRLDGEIPNETLEALENISDAQWPVLSRRTGQLEE